MNDQSPLETRLKPMSFAEALRDFQENRYPGLGYIYQTEALAKKSDEASVLDVISLIKYCCSNGKYRGIKSFGVQLHLRFSKNPAITSEQLAYLTYLVTEGMLVENQTDRKFRRFYEEITPRYLKCLGLVGNQDTVDTISCYDFSDVHSRVLEAKDDALEAISRRLRSPQGEKILLRPTRPPSIRKGNS